MNTQQMMEEIGRLARLCEAKDAEIKRLAILEVDLEQKVHVLEAQIAMQAEALNDVDECFSFGNEFQYNALDKVTKALSATSETVAAWRAKETEPMRREVARLHSALAALLDAGESEDDTSFYSACRIANNVLQDTQAAALAYEREVKAKALEDAAKELDDRHLESLQMCILPSTMVREMAAELRASKGEVK